MKAKEKKPLPHCIFVTRETDQNDPADNWLTTAESVDNIEADKQVGIYYLQGIYTMKVTRELK